MYNLVYESYRIQTRNKKRLQFLETLSGSGDPARIQTWNLLIRSQILYSVELRGQYFLSFRQDSNLKPPRLYRRGTLFS